MPSDPLAVRKPTHPIDPMFLDRWSPRAFSSEPVDDATVRGVFEAARWAPSCFGEEPWLFLYARTEEDLKVYRPLIVDGNRIWADKAPVLAFVFARILFDRNDKPNKWAHFDAGAAWMSLAFEARKQGLYAHGMGGIHDEKVHEVLGVPTDRYQVMCGVAIGRMGDASGLPEGLREREGPSGRRPLEEILVEGRRST